MTCSNCSKQIPPGELFTLLGPQAEGCFCSRRCLIEFVAPELKQAVVVSQWVPTEEETARMSE
jgi:hypothetical protein